MGLLDILNIDDNSNNDDDFLDENERDLVKSGDYDEDNFEEEDLEEDDYCYEDDE